MSTWASLAGAYEILNTSTGIENTHMAPQNTAEIAKTLKSQSLKIKAAFYHAQRGTLDYGRIKTSPEYLGYLRTSQLLPKIDLMKLTSAREKIAFWVNVYNSMVIHAVIAMGVQGSVDKTPGFFSDAAYLIGGNPFSLNEIEHGVLRANLPKDASGQTQFKLGDPRRRFSLAPEDFDARVHFVLHCASRSCPPIAFLEPETLPQQLDLAARSFIGTDPEIREDGVYVSRIFDWYQRDFKPSVRDFLMTYAKDDVKNALKKYPLKFKEYDWSLNGF